MNHGWGQPPSLLVAQVVPAERAGAQPSPDRVAVLAWVMMLTAQLLWLW
jgi:hypothetical protein